MMALVIGRAQTVLGKELIDLDRPLKSYGVPDSLANWKNNAQGIDYYPNVTLR